MNIVFKTYFVLALLFWSFTTEAQDILYSNAIIQVNDNALIHINGNAMFSGSNSILTNQGSLHTRNSITPAHINFEDSALISGNGDYKLQGNWINSASFICDSSHVFLDGDAQLISGDSVTTYHILELDSSGIKAQTIDANVNNQLILNHLELATDVNTMFVTNPSNNAVTNTQVFNQEGMVSSIGNGALNRSMNSSVGYLFPLGSSLNTRRYRPLDLLLSNATSNEIEARLVNHNPTIDGYDVDNHDSSLCIVNELYYHNIEQVAGSEIVSIDVQYLSQVDGSYNEMVQWETPNSMNWNRMNASTNTATPFQSVTVPNWNDFSNHQFALARETPNGLVIQGDSVICDSTITYNYAAIGSDLNTIYNWNVSDGLINQGQGSGEIDVSWLSGGTPSVSMTSVDTMGCESFPSMVNVNITHIDAAFDTVIGGLFGQVFTLNNSVNATDYFWEFGEWGNSTEENATYTFDEAGLHQIVLTVSNDLGCEDTASIWVEVLPGINVPNIFSPNGDGQNDSFRINAVGMISQELYIYNRWGQELYHTIDNTVEWGGTATKSDKLVPEGTYFYLYKASSLTKDFEYNGPLMLIR